MLAPQPPTINVPRRRLASAGAVLGLVAPYSVLSQYRVEIAGVGVRQIPIAVQGFRAESSAPQQASAVISANLERSGLFRLLEAPLLGADESSRLDAAAVRKQGADFLVLGSIAALADGRFDLRFRLWDVIRGQDMGAQSYVVAPADLRLAAHRASDFIHEKLTGIKGVSASRIAYVTKESQAGSPRYHLWIADADGEGAQSALFSAEPIISASWSPNGQQLAYVSFESRKPVVYSHDLGTGRRRLLANFRGSNSAPSWSPDSHKLAVTLTRDGNSQIYSIDAASGTDPRRLSQSDGIDTEPVYSRDGRHIYFVSDRGGSPQIYRMAALGEAGARAERITFSGNYNISPAISPDGKYLAFVSRVSGDFRLHVMELGTQAVVALTDTNLDERPSFAPNSKLILYVTRQAGRELLMTTTLDGKIKARLAAQGGDIREPQWGK